MAKRCKNCAEDCRGEVWGKKHRRKYGRIVRYSTCTCGCDNPEPINSSIPPTDESVGILEATL